MIFSELYGAYYTTMAKILEKAVEHPLEKGELRKIVCKYAFAESVINIEHSITEENWQLIKKDGTTPLHHIPTLPLTILQKRWLKAISLDARMKLFTDEIPGLENIEPLFEKDDILVFDKYEDGDPYEDEGYIRNFRLILEAIKNRYPLKITTWNRKGREFQRIVIPEYLEYSEKDDKFRLIASGHKCKDTINLARMISCERYDDEYLPRPHTGSNARPRLVELELRDERKALERVLLHFAHFKKEAEKIDDTNYRVSITYDKDDETEILIRILSFGPMIRVIHPNHFVNLIKERLIRQKNCS